MAEIQSDQETLLTDMARAHLSELDERLTLYLAQARLALARLYDDSLQNEFGSLEYEPDTENQEAVK